MTESTLIEALEGAKELFVEMKRLANELAAVKEENEALKRENERLEEQLQLSQSSVEGMKKSYSGVLHNLQLVYRRELPEAVTTVSNTLKEYSRETGSVLRKGKTSKLADEILTYLRDDDHKWIESGLREANIFAAQEKMSNETDAEYELRNRLLRETSAADVMIGFLRR